MRLMEAQRFPADYNGILAGDAAFNRTHLHMGGLALWQDTHATPGRFIQPGQMTLINNAVLAQCAGQDGGVKTDQFLTDPRDCHFDPKVLQCTGSNVPPACLSAEQVTTMRNYYAGVIDPRTGQVIYPGYERGNETDDIFAFGLAFQERLPEPVYDGLFYWVFGPSFGYPASAVNYANFDFHKDVDKVDDALAEPLNAVSTDLSDFKQRGNKLIMYHGWADTVIPSQSSINYFNALVHHDSQDDDGVQQARFEPDGDNNLRKTQEYARLFMVPGMYHCLGGPGPNVFDALTPLVNWVEQVAISGAGQTASPVRCAVEHCENTNQRVEHQVRSREWLEFAGGVISSLFAQTESALARRWRSRHEKGYHKGTAGSGGGNAFCWGRLVRSFGSWGADPRSRLH